MFDSIADGQELEDNRAISFGEFVSAFWAIQQPNPNDTVLPYSKRALVDLEMRGDSIQSHSPGGLNPPNLAKYDFNP